MRQKEGFQQWVNARSARTDVVFSKSGGHFIVLIGIITLDDDVRSKQYNKYYDT